jgi:hypothetical protein
MWWTDCTKETCKVDKKISGRSFRNAYSGKLRRKRKVNRFSQGVRGKGWLRIIQMRMTQSHRIKEGEGCAQEECFLKWEVTVPTVAAVVQVLARFVFSIFFV